MAGLEKFRKQFCRERRYNKENVLTLDSLVTVFLSEVLYEIRDELDEIEDAVLSGEIFSRRNRRYDRRFKKTNVLGGEK